MNLRSFTVSDFLKMAELGILTDEEWVELIAGRIIRLSRHSPPHATCVRRLNATLTLRLRDRVITSVRGPIYLDDLHMPVPDFALLKDRPDFYGDSHPQPSEVLLIVEVADRDDDYDRSVRLPVYAHASIPEVWLVEPSVGTIEVHRRPADRVYRETFFRIHGQTVSPEAFPDVVLTVESIVSR